MSKSSGWLIEQLEREKATFDDEMHPLPSYQQSKFDLCCELLQEDAASLAGKSRQRQSIRLRVRALLTDIFSDLGGEVFLLCTLAAPITTLATVSRKGLLPELRNWWKTSAHPQGLTRAAEDLRRLELIGITTVPTRKRQLSDDSIIIGKQRPF